MGRKMKTMSYDSPGSELLKMLEKSKLNQSQFARIICVSPGCINDIIHGKRKITVQTAKKIASFFKNTTVKYWLNLQTEFDLHKAS